MMSTAILHRNIILAFTSIRNIANTHAKYNLMRNGESLTLVEHAICAIMQI